MSNDVHTQPPWGYRSSGEPPVGTRLVLVRHGEAVCNVEGYAGGLRTCVGLTDRGREQAHWLRTRLERSDELRDVTHAYVSMLPRAKETAEIVLGALSPMQLIADCDLCEIHMGEADGLTWAQINQRFGGADWDLDPDQEFAPGGESWTGFYHRTIGALERLAERHPHERVIVFCHGGVIEHALKYATGRSAQERLFLVTSHCSMTEIEIDGDRVRLLSYNDRAPREVTAD